MGIWENLELTQSIGIMEKSHDGVFLNFLNKYS